MYLDGTTAIFYNDWQSYTFVVGSATVIDRYGNWYGLDVVPQVINDRFYIPAKFFQDAMGLSYTWDSVTNTIFLNSDATYQWLISTPEHQEGKAIKQTWDAVQGWWLNYNDMEYMSHHSENICFYPDGTFYYRTWRIKGYGTYRVTRPNIIEVNYDIYFNGAGTTTYGYDYSTSDTYQLSGNRLNGDFQRVSGYCYPNGEQ